VVQNWRQEKKRYGNRKSRVQARALPGDYGSVFPPDTTAIAAASPSISGSCTAADETAHAGANAVIPVALPGAMLP